MVFKNCAKIESKNKVRRVFFFFFQGFNCILSRKIVKHNDSNDWFSSEWFKIYKLGPVMLVVWFVIPQYLDHRGSRQYVRRSC